MVSLSSVSLSSRLSYTVLSELLVEKLLICLKSLMNLCCPLVGEQMCLGVVYKSPMVICNLTSDLLFRLQLLPVVFTVSFILVIPENVRLSWVHVSIYVVPTALGSLSLSCLPGRPDISCKTYLNSFIMTSWETIWEFLPLIVYL